MNDRRSSRRVIYQTEVSLLGSASPPFKAYSQDLSLGGMYLNTQQQFSQGMILQLRFTVEDAEIRTMAEVVHCQPGAGLGLKFLSLTADQEAIIRTVTESDE
ncbi:MAG TPA: PilZ domain-containing protein [Blastocatellia bacterium]|nr:PilZ domain-containing protein [Blastocatellia bacterium]